MRVRGLATAFEPLAVSDAFTPAHEFAGTHFFANRRLYLVLEPLEKLHPAFDAALAEIMRRDPVAEVVVPFQSRRSLWKEALLRRLRVSLGRAAAKRVRRPPRPAVPRGLRTDAVPSRRRRCASCPT